MGKAVSKTEFRSHVLEYCHQVEKTRKPLTITDRGKPILTIVPYEQDAESILKSLRGSVLHYENPTDPVGVEDWEVLR
jgi:prevent-host-death family protein